ncbi:uncharacterized protein EKO05_0006503 [Ascochyta rabiei]|uniref:Uncharacterized protein n=1 Tax=Didymella rabiei TaxID=5454 RepID=A0A162W7V4_DIDRA|nr:uncharacterized protein EKO05_0006503 [Ascochyta rabiei]KZM18856.1 hypothetical protein ST47_g10135 [Ascochyta rabiei]UPX16079.1 hypothetical protein EKO05_0006503 [Ascochyta rabiei]
MFLSHLPPELKLSIVEHLDPESSLRFALTNRYHSKLCQAILREHTRLFAEHSIIEANDAGPVVLWNALREILRDPRKGWYVRELNLPNSREELVTDIIPEEDLKLYKDAAQEISSFCAYQPTFFAAEPDDDPGDFDESMDNLIESGTEEAAVVLLIHHLPQLRTFRMTDGGRRTGACLELFMHRVAAGYQDPTLAPRMPLQHLRTAAIAHYDSEGSCNIAWAVYFLCVPSLRTFAAQSMGSEGLDEHEGGSGSYLRNVTGAPVSNVEELSFDYCQFDSQSLQVILSMLKNLKRFSYQSGGATVAYSDYEPRRVIEALATYAGHSLEEAELLGCEIGFEDGDNDLLFTSLQGFTTLKALRCETRWLLRSHDTGLGDGEALSQGFHSVEDAEEAITDPRDNLPESLEELYLDGVYEDEEWEQLTELFKNPNTSTPKLTLEKTCVMRHSKAWDRRGVQEKVGGAAEPGIRFTNPLHMSIWDGHGY